MKTRLLLDTVKLLPLLLSVSAIASAQQLKLGDNPTSIQKSALLELESKSQGLLLPRIADTTLAPINAAPDGMLIYLTTNKSIYIRANGYWQKLIPQGSAAGGDLTGAYPDPQIANGAVTGAKIAQAGATSGQVLKWNGTTWAPAADNNTGSISSIGLTVPSLLSVTPATLTANGTFSIGLNSQTANTFFAAPDGAAGNPAFRSIVAADIPALDAGKITTGILPVARGGTGLSTVGAAGTVLTSNGTTLSYTAIPSGAFTLTGDVTGTGSGSVATTIANQAVTFAKMQNINTQKLLGRFATGAGSPQEVALDNSIKLNTGGTLYTDSSLAIWNASELQGRRVAAIAPTDNYILKWDATANAWIPKAETSATNWLFTGNSNTTATSFLGTTVDQPMVLKYNNTELFRGTKGTGAYTDKTVALFNGASSYNGHPVVIRANGNDVLAFQDESGTTKWHWNMLAGGLNFVETNVMDYRLFLQNGGHVGINTSTPEAYLDVEGDVKLGTNGTVFNGLLRATGVSVTATGITSTNPVTVTVAMANVTANASVIVNPRASLPAGVAIAFARTTAGNVIIKFINTTGTAASATGTYDITVIQ
ncbi:hypothetical protein [Chitinophaga tropicalis]|uniref:MBG domain-containing protein n=1 Tax=Chitinophaga tropicalis TaxID=2683588 RepID=A0A7K1UB47_9BACT|nr:hypothetical protein [Chitinophaga tropicalis]MVT11480.1 hypothetical protein [Chitinophaga tropicalis]